MHIRTFSDGRVLSFGRGRFDDWCVWLEQPGKWRTAPTDSQYFARLDALAQMHGGERLYQDFVRFYECTTAVIDCAVLELIPELSAGYEKDRLEIEVLFTIIYAGMVAEENKAHAVLRKRIKRLGMYQTLMERMPAGEAASFSRGKPWQELHMLCAARGF